MNKDTRVLIVEDNLLNSEMTQGVLEDLGYTVVGVATDGHQAIEIAKSIQPDVILMDIKLPGIDGIQVTRHIHESCPTPVVMLTAYDTLKLVERASAAGAGAYLTKPINPREVERAITVTIARFDDMMRLRCLNKELQAEITERMRVEKALRESKERFRELAEMLPEIIYETDAQGVITFLNRHAFEITGYTQEDLEKGLTVTDLLIPQDLDRARRNMGRLFQGEKIEKNEYSISRKDGGTIPIIEQSAPVIQDGKVVGLWGIILDITERKRTEERIKASLREKEVLLREIHHRVKNNLQIVSSLLELQAEFVQDAQTVEVLRDSHTRIQSMAFIHEQLYQSEDLSRIDFAEYVQNLVDGLFTSYDVSSTAVTIKTNISDVVVDIDTAIPYGLLITELVSNSLKHAFPNDGTGEICIGFYPNDDGRLVLVVRDNGIGLPKGLDAENTKSFGLRLVYMLTRQLGGTIEIDRSHGTKFKISWLPSRNES